MNSYFKKESLILTKTGYKSIESLVAEDLVLTQFGDWNKVTNIKSTTSNFVYEVKGVGTMPLCVTQGSKVLVKKSTVDTIEWMDTQDIKEGYFVAFTVPSDHDTFEDTISMFNTYLHPMIQIADEKQLETNHSFINGRYLFSHIDSVTKVTYNPGITVYGIDTENSSTCIVNGSIVKI